jgi:hypothetical protein
MTEIASSSTGCYVLCMQKIEVLSCLQVTQIDGPSCLGMEINFVPRPILSLKIIIDHL